MQLTRKQFDVLEILATTQESLSQRGLEKATGYSLGTINKVLKELTEARFVLHSRLNYNVESHQRLEK